MSSSIFREHLDFRRKRLLGIDIVDWTQRKLLRNLFQDALALPHFLHADQISVECIADCSYGDLEIVVLVIEIRMFAAEVMLYSRTAQVRTGKRVGNRVLLRNHPDVLAAIDKDSIPGQELVHFLDDRLESSEELAQLWYEGLGQITRLAPHPRIVGREPSSTQQFDQVVNLLPLIKRVEENGRCAKIHGHAPIPTK